jgi:signal transduction histidine kinase/Tfp pilus assembly protein PilF
MSGTIKKSLLAFVVVIAAISTSRGNIIEYYDSLCRQWHQEIITLWQQCREDHRTDPETGIRRTLQTYKRARQLNYLSIMQHTTHSIGVYYNELGNYKQAEAWLQKALQLGMRSPKRSWLSARTLNNLGEVYLYQGKYKEALDYMFKGARIAEGDTVHKSDISDVLTRIYNNIGATLLYTHETDRALVYLNKGIRLAKQIASPERQAHLLNTMAKAYLQRGELAQARKLAEEAYQSALDNKPSRVEYTALQTLAEIFIAEGAPHKAIPYLKSVLESDYFLNPYYKSGILYTIGNCYYAGGDYPNAFHWLHKTFLLATEARVTEYLLRYHRLAAVLYADQGDYYKVYLHQQQAYLLNDSLLNTQKKEAVSQLEIRYRTAEKDMELVRRQLVISEQRNYLKRKNIMLYSISGGALLAGMLGFSFYRASRQKQKIHLLKAVIDREEQERTRIGQDLHDGIGSRLAAINMYFAATLRRYGRFEGRNEIEKIMKMMVETSGEIRNTAHNLIPDILSHNSFPEAVNLYCEQFSNERLNILVQIEEDIPELNNERLALILFRIIQELVQNIVRHAQATEAIVEIIHQDKELHITVEDNGNGFNPDYVTSGMGLDNIRQRVKLLQGDISIHSSPDIGTSIVIRFELHQLKTTSL